MLSDNIVKWQETHDNNHNDHQWGYGDAAWAVANYTKRGYKAST